jgi:predicted TIM-barrel fold metal-dependent hydrolase
MGDDYLAKNLHSLSLPDVTKQKILGDNAIKLFGLED